MAATPPSVSGPAASAINTEVELFIEMIDELVGIIEQETMLVRAGRLREAAPLERHKADLSQRFTNAAARIDALDLPGSAPLLAKELRPKHERLQGLLQSNQTVLATAHAVSEGILRGVSGELARKAAPSTYGATGRANAPGPSAAQPLAVSRVL